jgi:hypothetical protein
MSKIVNNRRKAVSSVHTYTAKPTSEFIGNSIRKNVKLTDVETTILNMFKTNDNRTERDVFIAFRTVPYNANKVCVETDTAPYLVVEDIIGMDKRNPTDFYVPVYPLYKNSVWSESKPKIENWLYSSCRYPKISDDNKTIVPNYSMDNNRQCSPLDIYELYTSMFIGTLNKYFSVTDKIIRKKYAKNCYLVLFSMKKILDEFTYNVDINKLLEKKEKLQSLITVRDKSEYDAIEYKKYVSKLEVPEYYWIMYNLMIEAPEIVHKSNLMNMDVLLMGLLTQTRLVSDNAPIGCTFDGIHDNVLRMILERSMKRIPKINCDEYVQLDELVEHLHKNAGRSVENSLRYWAFVTETINLVSEREHSLNNFVERLTLLCDHIFKFNGIIPFCLLISPSSDKYLSDETIAEYIYTVSSGNKKDQKFATLNATMLVSKTEMPNLYKLLNSNIDRINNSQKELDIDKSIYDPDSDPDSDNQDYNYIWDKFLVETGCINAPNMIHSGKSSIYKQWIIKLAQMDNVDLLKAFISNGQKVHPPLLGSKRTQTLIIRAIKPDSDVFAYCTNISPSIKYNYSKIISDYKFSKSKTAKILRDLVRNMHDVNYYGNKSTNEENNEDDVNDIGIDNSIIEFVKFEKAKEIVQINIEQLMKSIIEIKIECPICFETCDKLEELHFDIRHGVCSSCSLNLSTCPFCRVNLNKHNYNNSINVY